MHRFDTLYEFSKYRAGIAFVSDLERFLVKTGTLQAASDGQEF